MPYRAYYHLDVSAPRDLLQTIVSCTEVTCQTIDYASCVTRSNVRLVAHVIPCRWQRIMEFRRLDDQLQVASLKEHSMQVVASLRTQHAGRRSVVVLRRALCLVRVMRKRMKNING